MAPKFLSDEQKIGRMQMCQVILEYLDADLDQLKRVNTGDETCVFDYDPET